MWGGFEGRVVASDSHGPPEVAERCARAGRQWPQCTDRDAVVTMGPADPRLPLGGARRVGLLRQVGTVQQPDDAADLLGIVDHPQDRALCVRGDRPGGSALRSYRAASAYSSM